MICKNCHAELADDATVCEQCGCDLTEPTPVEPDPYATPAEPTPVAESIEPTPVAAPVSTPYIPESNFYAAPISAVPAPKKKKGLIIGLIAAVVILAAVAVVIYLGCADGRTVDEARSLADDGEYVEALDLLDSIEDPSSDVKKEIKSLQNEIYESIENEVTTLLENGSPKDALDCLNRYDFIPNYEKVLKNIYEAMENEVTSLLENGSPKDALECLNDYDFIPNYDKVLKKVYEAMEDEIFALMDEGEYIKAQELLDDYDFLPSHNTLAAQIKYESFIIYAAFDLRPIMKNPSSLQISTVEIYEYTSDDYIYPTLVFYSTGQNGFGGYSGSYEVFLGDDLTYTGSTSTLDTDDIDDYSDYLVAYLILLYRENDDYAGTDAVYDLARINSFLPNGKMPNIDITQYARQTGENAI